MRPEVLPLVLIGALVAMFGLFELFVPGGSDIEILTLGCALGLIATSVLWGRAEEKRSEIQREADDRQLLLLAIRSEEEVRYILGVYSLAMHSAFETETRMRQDESPHSTLQQRAELAAMRATVRRRKETYWRLRACAAKLFPEQFPLEKSEKNSQYLPNDGSSSNILYRYRSLIESI